MDIFQDKILPLFVASGKSDMELEKEIGLPRSIIYDWKSKRSKSYKNYIVQIANYFNVSPNEFINTNDQDTYNLYPIPEEYQSNYRFLNQQAALLRQMSAEVQFLCTEYLKALAQLQEAQGLLQDSKSNEHQKIENQNSNKRFNAEQMQTINATVQYNKALRQLKRLEDRISEITPIEVKTETAARFDQLSKPGKEKVNAYINDLLDTGKYTKNKAKK